MDRQVKAVISVKDLHKTFQTEAGQLHILKGIDVEFYAGEMTCIMGASGAGKSTFLHILGTLDRPSAGTVMYQDEEPFLLPRKALAEFRNRKVGFVFQFHYLLPEFTALENIMMPALVSNTKVFESTSQAKAHAEMLAKELGVYDRRFHKPGELSGGEQQRVAVARALMMSPDVLLADEPTGNLDTTTGEALFELFLQINKTKGTTFVIVTHNENLAKKCHKTLIMKDGKLC